MTRLLRTICIAILLSLSACQVGDYTVARRSAIDKEIAAARADTTAHLALLNDQQLSLLRQSVAAQEARAQGASDYLTKASISFATIKVPSRTEMVMGQSVQQAAAQLPAPSAAAQAKAYADLRTELDETKISTDALRAQYDAQLTQARAEGVAKDKALTDIAATLKHVDEEKVSVLTKANATEAALSDKRKEVDDTVIGAQAKDLANAKSVQALKAKMSSITGILTLLCIAGAIWSPAFKQQLGLGAVVFGIVTAAIWYVTPLMIAIAVGVAGLVLVGWMVKNHYIESKTASSVYHAIQSVKDTAGADYDRILKPKLEEWMSTYTKDGKTVPDVAAVAHVDKVLMQTGAK